MIYEPITPERLRGFRLKTRELNRLIEQKASLIEKIRILKSIDYSKVKVTLGNKRKISEQERYVSVLETINKEIDYYKYKVFKTEIGKEYGLIEEAEVIKTQLERIPEEHYKKLIIRRYLQSEKFSAITFFFFCGEKDYEENYQHYLEKTMDWHKSALEKLEKVSNKPYVKTSKQLVIEEGNNERIIEKRT